MLRSVAVLAFAAVLPLGGVVAATAEAAPRLDVVTICYDVSGAPDWGAAVDQAAANWNAALTNVQLARCEPPTVIFYETYDGQGAHTDTDGHGNATVYVDQQQVTQGYDAVRIAAHEFGHVLGLPDNYEGPCSEIMSGGGPGPSCTNASPDAAEAALVDELWANGFATAA